MSDMDKVIGRVRKLLRLAADGGATEAEAALAAEFAQAIMADHNLSMASIEAAGESSGEDGRRETAKEEGRAMYAWQRDLMEVISKANFCWSEVTTRWLRGADRNVGYRIIGRAANVAATRVSFDYLVATVNRLVLVDCGGDNRLRMSRAGHSFAEGAADRLGERVRERHEAIVEERSRAAREANAANRHPSAATGNVPAVVMQDFEQVERDLNDDLRYGRAPGTTARQRAEYEAETERRQAKLAADTATILAELMETCGPLGLDLDRATEMAELLARGHSRESVDMFFAKLDKPARPETERQKRERIEREERQNRRYWERQARLDDKRDRAAYQRGSEAAEAVGLDTQVDEAKRGKLR